MNSERLNQLLSFYNDDPNDPFILYGLAMEYWKYNLEKARQFFELLLDNHPDYLATYYQAAHLYEDLEEDDLAIETYKRGIHLAEEQGNQNALRELKNALEQLDF